MFIYLLQRLLLLLLTLFTLTLISFSIYYKSGDPAITQLSLVDGYFNYLHHLYQGDFGVSLVTGKAITPALKKMLLASLEIVLLSLGFSFFIGFPLGIVAAINKGKLIDRSLGMLTIFGFSVPLFWLSLLSILLFSYHLGWMPNYIAHHDSVAILSGQTNVATLRTLLVYDGPRSTLFLEIISHLLIPIILLSLPFLVEMLRLVRNSVVNILRTNYIKVASTRGTSYFFLVYQHVIRNALPHILPILGLQFPIFLSLMMVIEYIFLWPGIGNALIYASRHQDYALISAITFAVGGVIILANILSKIASSIMDPLRYKRIYEYD